MDAAHGACARARCRGPSLPPGLTRGSGAAEGGHLSLSLPYLPSSAAKGWLWGQGWGGPRQGSPTCGPQHHGRRRGGDRTESHLPPAAPTGPLAFPACSPGCRGGEKRPREVRVDSSTSAGQSQAPDGSFSLQGPTLTRGNCCSDPSVIIRPQTSLIHYDVPCTPVIQTLMVGRGQPVESRLRQSRPEACPGASGPSPRAAPSRQAQLCHQSAVCQPGARGPRNATFQPPGV